MNSKLKILIAAAEVAPLAKVGGLGDVVGALPKALVKLNLDARVIVPFYGAIDRNKYKIKSIKQNIKAGAESVNPVRKASLVSNFKSPAAKKYIYPAIDEKSFSNRVNLWRTHLPDSGVPVYLIEHKLFKNKKIYSTALADGPTDIEKFVFFSQAILASIKVVNFAPNIIHLNDWHTAAVAALLKTDRFFKQTKTLYTIHNLANQGKTKSKNYMAEGILNANLINTVSPTYAKEILTKEYGAGLENILAKRKKQLFGILNGLDTDFFNPQTDRLIKYNYSAKSLTNKTLNKLALQRLLGLPQNQKIALVGLVTRFVGQKGIDLISEKFAKLNCQFVFLGMGEKKYEDGLMALAKNFPDKFSVQIKFDERLAHQIYAASDIFLVPSRFEPCGLTQLIALRYGSVPVVRSTGGLTDTVTPLTKGAGGIKPTGFTFKKIDSDAFYEALTSALNTYYQKPKVWRQLQLNGMRQDFSWNKSAGEYLKIYKKLLQ